MVVSAESAAGGCMQLEGRRLALPGILEGVIAAALPGATGAGSFWTDGWQMYHKLKQIIQWHGCIYIRYVLFFNKHVVCTFAHVYERCNRSILNTAIVIWAEQEGSW